MIKPLGKTMLALALAVGGSTSLSGCDTTPIGEAGAQAIEATGDVDFALQAAPGLIVNKASYTITGPNAFTKVGSFDLLSAARLTGTVGGLVAGMGYQIALSATATDGTTTCAGAATFNVVPRVTSSVVVPLDCHEAPRLGSASVTGVINVCPVIDGIGANPSTAQVGAPVALLAVAHDSDSGPSALAYQWSATSGSFSDPVAQSPSFMCATPGIATVTLVVSDGDTHPQCAATLTAQITCTP